MMAFNPTDQQKKALDAKGTVLVSAAAGSGKTAVLSNRVVNRVTDSDNPVDITDLLIVTFTNAAAAEMRERISSLLGEKAEANPENYRLMRQKLAVDSAHIGTIDSFCIDLVRDNFAEAGVNPDFKIISTDRFDVIKTQQINNAYMELSVTDYEAYCRLLTSLGREDVDKIACEAVYSIYKHIRSLPMPDRWLDQAEAMYTEFSCLKESPWFKLLIDYVFDAADYNLTAIIGVNDLLYSDEKIVKGYETAYLYLNDILGKIKSAAANNDFDGVYNAVSSYVKPNMSGVKCENVNARNMVRAAINNARDCVEKLVSRFKVPLTQAERDIRDAADTVRTLIHLVRIFKRNMEQVFEETSTLDFPGVEHKALGLLCEDIDGKLCIKESAVHLCNRFKEVMVDEYQDTNDLQNAIFDALSGNSERLFLVGDVKQCIYRFRQANPNNFIYLRDMFDEYNGEDYPSKIDLSGNFRSRPEICDFVNFCFSLLMSKKSSSIDYLEGDRLDPKGTFEPTEEEPVEVHLLDVDDIPIQAEHVAKYIKSCVERKMPVSDKNGMRPVRYGDFMVLLRSTSKYGPDYVSAMKNNGVPVSADIKSQYFDRPEIMMIMSLLNAIDNPLRDVSLLGSMMSPVFGFSADEMAKMRICDRKGSLYSALLKYANESQKAQEFLDKLNKYRAWADTMPIDRLISRIYDDTGLTAVVRAMDDGASRRANLLALVGYAADYERGGNIGLGAFIRHTENVKKFDIEISGAAVADSDDTVKIMTIHGSKGLQSPVCIVAGLENPFNTSDVRSALLMHEKYGIGMRVCDLNRALRYDTVSRVAISLVERQASVAEEMRLLYVAMTRAQDKLVLVSSENKLDEKLGNAGVAVMSGWNSVNEPIDSFPIKNVSKMSEWLLMCLELHPDGEKIRNRAGIEITPTSSKYGLNIKVISSSSIVDIREKGDDIEQSKLDCSQMLDYRYPYEGLLKVESKYSVSELSKNSSLTENAFKSKPAFVTGDTLTPAEKGTATHRFMCYADFERAEQSVADEANLLVSAGKLTVEQARGIDVEAVTAFFESEIYERLCNAVKVMRESRFIFEIPAREVVSDCDSDEPVIVQGVADCVIFEPDGMIIVDFKTDRNTTAEAIKERYTKQLDLYARAFSSNYKMPVKQCLLYSFSLRKTVDIALA